MPQKIYPRSNDKETIYLKSVITNPNIIVGDYTIYNDFAGEPKNFEKNNVLYQYPVNRDKLLIGKFCSIACGQSLYLTVQIIRYRPCQPTRFLFSLKNGD